ncbi:ATP-binding protein [Nitrosopumilus sp.]|nr:ATP-binding protein [Nitrosopumilus sp.]
MGDNNFLQNDHIFEIANEFINSIKNKTKNNNNSYSQTLSAPLKSKIMNHGLLFWGNVGLGKSTIIKLLKNQIMESNPSIKLITLDVNAYVLKNNADVIISVLNDCLQYSLRNIIIFIDNLDTLPTSMQMVINIWIYNNIFTNNIYFICTCTNILNILPPIVELNTIVNILPRNYESWTASFLTLAKKLNYLEPIDTHTLEYIYSISRGNGHVDLQMLNKLLYFGNIKCTNVTIYNSIINELVNNIHMEYINQNIIKKCFELITLGEDIVDILSTILILIKNENTLTNTMKNNVSYVCNMYIFKRKNSKYNSINDKILLITFCNELIDIMN